MAKIEDVLRESLMLTPLQQAVLTVLESHPAEVFAYGDPELQALVGMGKPTSINWTLWYLNRRGFIGLEKLGRRAYFGSKAAIAELGRQKELQKQRGRKESATQQAAARTGHRPRPAPARRSRRKP